MLRHTRDVKMVPTDARRDSDSKSRGNILAKLGLPDKGLEIKGLAV